MFSRISSPKPPPCSKSVESFHRPWEALLDVSPEVTIFRAKMGHNLPQFYYFWGLISQKKANPYRFLLFLRPPHWDLRRFLTLGELRGIKSVTKRATRDHPCRNYSFSGAKFGKSYYFFGLILGVLTGKHLGELPGACFYSYHVPGAEDLVLERQTSVTGISSEANSFRLSRSCVPNFRKPFERERHTRSISIAPSYVGDASDPHCKFVHFMVIYHPWYLYRWAAGQQGW